MDGIYELIRVIYDPKSDPAALQSAQAQLQSLQRSPDGWEIGRRLLQAPENPSAQFLGAQTYQICINSGISEQAALEMRNELIQWIKQGSWPPFVLRKLLSTTSSLFQHWPKLEQWPGVIQEICSFIGMCNAPEFLTMLVEDAEGSKSVLRPALEPVAPLVLDLISLQEASLEMYNVWATAYFDLMTPALLRVLGFLEESDSAATVVRDLFETQWEQWPAAARDALIPIVSIAVSAITEEDIDNHIELARLVLALGNHPKNLGRMPDLETWILHYLVNPEVKVVDDPIAEEVIGYWTEYCEDVPVLNDKLVESLFQRYWPRIRLYDGVESEWTEFNSFRQFFRDFLEAVYARQESPALLELLGNTASQALSRQDWTDIEAALDCLSGLEDAIERTPEPLIPLVRSDLWSKMIFCPRIRVHQTVARSIGCLQAAFVAGKALTPALEYLFAFLAEPSLQLSVSRGLESLVNGAESQLVDGAASFLEAWARLRPGFVELSDSARVLGTVCRIINAVPDALSRMSYIEKLVDYLGTQPDLPSLRLLEAVSSAISGSVELHGYADATQCREKIWTLVCETVHTSNVDVCETTCRILKNGLREQDQDMPNDPFSMPSSLILDFVHSQYESGPAGCRPFVVDLASRLVNSEHAEGRLISSPAQIALYSMIARPTPSTDVQGSTVELGEPPAALTEAPDSSLKLLTALVPSISPDTLPQAEIVLKSLVIPLVRISSNRFIVQAETQFWTEFAGAKLLTDTTGLSIMREVVLQLCGEAPRSAVSDYARILASIVKAQPRIAGNWLQHELVQDPAPIAASLPLQARLQFSAQVQMLRGGPQTKDTAMQFWLQARGLPEKY